MFWYDNLYLGKNCLYKVNRLKYKITNRIVHPTVYLIILPQNAHAVLEMIPSSLLLQASYPTEDMKIIGMAISREEGTALIREIIEEVYQEQGDFDVAAFAERSMSCKR